MSALAALTAVGALVVLGLSMVVAAVAYSTLHWLFGGAGFGDGWSLAWGEPFRLTGVAVVMAVYKLLVQLGGKQKEQRRVRR